jgi:hypothetical protein
MNVQKCKILQTTAATGCGSELSCLRLLRTSTFCFERSERCNFQRSFYRDWRKPGQMCLRPAARMSASTFSSLAFSISFGMLWLRAAAPSSVDSVNNGSRVAVSEQPAFICVLKHSCVHARNCSGRGIKIAKCRLTSRD